MSDARLARIEVILSRMLDVLETHTEMLTDLSDRQKDLVEWLKEPPKSDLAEVLRQLTAAVGTMQEQLLDLPGAVARAVVDGEVR
jgi:hypothetical protein